MELDDFQLIVFIMRKSCVDTYARREREQFT